MGKTIILCGFGLAVAALGVQWLQSKAAILFIPAPIYILIIAAIFTGLGIWAGAQLIPRTPSAIFEQNHAAIASLGLTPKEVEVLDLLNKGYSNKEVSKKLGVSINTTKTHISSLFEKLQVARRSHAVNMAKGLGILS